MSGGHFDYKQYHIDEIANAVQKEIDNNVGGYSASTLQEFTVAVSLLRRAAIYAQRIDWLLSGDDGEETFHQRLETELKKVPNINGWSTEWPMEPGWYLSRYEINEEFPVSFKAVFIKSIDGELHVHRPQNTKATAWVPLEVYITQFIGFIRWQKIVEPEAQQ